MSNISSMDISDKIKFLDSIRIRKDKEAEEIVRYKSAIEFIKAAREEEKNEDKSTLEDFNDPIDDLDDFEEEVKYYLSDFLNIKEFSREAFEAVLPSRSNYNYAKILLRIMAEITHDIIDIKNIICSNSDMNNEELEEFIQELESLDDKRYILKEILLTEEKTEVLENKNNLIFLPIVGTNEVRIFDELKYIPQEKYAGFLELFQSIKNGTFKNVRRFVNNSEYSGMIEVKGHQVRVAFQRLSNDCYAIISMFVKKSQNSYGYRVSLANRYSEYKLIENELREKVKDPKFILENREYEDKLFSILSNEKVNEGEASK